MELIVIGGDFTVCKVASFSCADLDAPFCFAARTDEERSLVCPTDRVPAETLAREDGWRMLRVAGTLDFSLTGVLAHIAGVLAEAGVSVFAVSTFDTDYVLLKAAQLPRALEALPRAGYSVGAANMAQ